MAAKAERRKRKLAKKAARKKAREERRAAKKKEANKEPALDHFDRQAGLNSDGERSTGLTTDPKNKATMAALGNPDTANLGDDEFDAVRGAKTERQLDSSGENVVEPVLALKEGGKQMKRLKPWEVSGGDTVLMTATEAENGVEDMIR